MSKIKALITALVLGSSSAAMAAPGLTFTAQAQASWGTVSPTIRDHRTVSTYQAPSSTFARGTWISLAEPMNLRRGRAAIDINSRSTLNQLRLQSASGSTYIGTVTVRFVNGASQVVTLNKWLDARSPMAQFNLNRTMQVDSILINGQRNARGGKVQVFGYASSTRPTPPIYQPERPPVYQPPVYQPRAVVLADALTFAHTDGWKNVAVGAEKGTFSTLRIQAKSGTVFVEKVYVAFTNGYEQTMTDINANLFRGQNVDLKLDGAGQNSIRRIVVWTNESNQPIDVSTGEFTLSAF